MKTYQGGCHCGQVRFEVLTDMRVATRCNCSICTKKGVLHHRVPSSNFKLLAGHTALTLYQFDTRVAKHWFCEHCGIHAFSNPRAAPEQTNVNVYCLDDYEKIKNTIELKLFDGKNWDEAIKTFDVQR